jgi:molecular chaperone Hsp33
MADNDNGGYETPDTDSIQFFQLETAALRGRAISLSGVLGDILSPHAYPEPVARLLAESVTLTLLVASMIKYDGIFTLQIKGDGPVSMLVADVLTNGDVRACATFDAEHFKVVPLKPATDVSIRDLLGKGHIVFTVDQPASNDRYQGIVELEGSSLVECMQGYFRQSEQIATTFKMAIETKGAIAGGGWRAGAIMLQAMPQDGGYVQGASLSDEEQNDAWIRASALLDTCTAEEMLDPKLHSNALLFRLFHEEGVRVFAPRKVQKNCRCSAERVQNVLSTMPPEDIDFIAKDGIITVKCEFCSRDYDFDRESITAISDTIIKV